MTKINTLWQKKFPERSERVIKRLREIVGEGFVAVDRGTLYIYSQDLTENEPAEPMAVVMPENEQQIVEIVRLANQEKTPLTPFVGGLNMGGLAIPLHGGVVVDMKRMRRILEVNEDSMYILVEPGVTFGHIRAYLDRHHPHFRYSYPLAPPHTSVICNALMDGLNNLSLRHGAMGEWISGLETVLPTGELTRIGSCAITESWHGREPLPDLAGLFVGWQGATGIVTKAALNIWHKPPLEHRSFLPLFDTETAYLIMRDIGRMEIFDDLACVSWPTGKMLFGARGVLTRQPDEPLLYVHFSVSAYSEKELAVKRELATDVLNKYRNLGRRVEDELDLVDLLKVNPGYAKLAEFPTTLDFLLDYGPGGLTWMGSYGPGSTWAEGADAIFAIIEENGFYPVLVSRPMKGCHFWVLRFILHFDRNNPAEVKQVKETLSRIGDAALQRGYLPYKPPLWAVEKMKARDKYGFFDLMQRIKQALDPNNIMNPGRWGL